MGWTTQADDWNVSGIMQLGGAGGIGGGIFLFQFQSYDAGQEGHYVIFMAVGLGLGGDLGGASVPVSDIIDSLRGKTYPIPTSSSFTALNCDNSFSMKELTHSPGRLTTAGAGFALGYSLVYITATRVFHPLFRSQSCGGWGTGVGAVAITTVGMWQWIGSAPYQWGAT